MSSDEKCIRTKKYQLVPLAAEDYGVDMESNVMYAVAVAKRTDLTSNRKRIHVHFV